MQGQYDAMLAALRQRRDRRGAAARGAHGPAARRPPAARHAGARPTPPSAPASSWSGRRSGSGRFGWSTPCSAGSRPRPLDDWLDEPRGTDGDLAGLALRHSHPRWVVDAFADGARGRGRRHGRACPAARRRQRGAAGHARGTARPRHRSPTSPRYGVAARPLLAVRRRPRRRGPARPGGSCARARSGVQDEGSQLAALVIAARRGRRPGPALAGSVCAGRAARRPC